MRGASMPDSRATIVSASSEVSRCWVSKSAGTYSASITGVIGSTLRSRTLPFQVCDNVAAVAIAGRARSVSARSSGTRIELNICPSVDGMASLNLPRTRSLGRCAWLDITLAHFNDSTADLKALHHKRRVLSGTSDRKSGTRTSWFSSAHDFPKFVKVSAATEHELRKVGTSLATETGFRP